MWCFFFFFQAEDGIRDGHVTGVQTCALPISLWANVKIDRSNNDVSPQRRDRSLMRYMFQENNRAVIDDGVNAGELTEERDQDGHDQCFSECGIQQIPALF